MLEQAHDIAASFLVNIERFGFFLHTGCVLDKCLDEKEYSRLFCSLKSFKSAFPLAKLGTGQIGKNEQGLKTPPFPRLCAGATFLGRKKTEPRGWNLRLCMCVCGYEWK